MIGTPLDSYLDPGERLLWSGQPKQGVRFRASDFYQIPFSIFWCGFVVVWECIALQIPFAPGNEKHHSTMAHFAVWLFPLWGLPFLVMGIHLLVGRFLYDAGMRKRTWYALSDRRLIILKSYLNSTVNSFDHASMINLNLVERADGAGDILFGTPYPAMPFSNASWPGSRRTQIPGFYDLCDARAIYNQIRDVQNQARK